MRELLRLALPIAAAQAGTQLMGLVDIAVLGRLGARELAAAGLGNALFFAISIAGMGMMFGIDPLIAQAIGAGDRLRARRVLWQGIWLAIVVAAVLTLLLVGVAYALPWFGTAEELIEPARTYVQIRTIGLLPFLLFFVVRAYLQAHGATRPMLIAMIAANVFNFAADILFVFGGRVLPPWAGPLRELPAMGIAGAAIATVLCAVLQLAMVASAVRHIAVDGHVNHRPDGVQIGQAFVVGTPIALQMSAEIGIFALVGVLAARLGTLHAAAHQLAIGLASFTYTVALGVAAAGTVRVGMAVGARNSRSTRIAGHATFLLGALVMAMAGVVFLIAPRELARLITNKAEVIAAATPLMLVAAVFQLSDGVQGVGAGVLRGAGDTKFTLYANIIGHWMLGLPVALLLGFQLQLGIVGLWWGLCLGLTIVAILLFIRFELLSRTDIAPL